MVSYDSSFSCDKVGRFHAAQRELFHVLLDRIATKDRRRTEYPTSILQHFERVYLYDLVLHGSFGIIPAIFISTCLYSRNKDNFTCGNFK